MVIQMVRVHAIEPGEETPPAAVSTLVESVRQHGVLEPLIVQKRDRRYRLITAPLNAFHRPRVTVAAIGEPAGRVTLAVIQQSVAAPRAWPSTPDGSEGYALVPILALRHIAEASGGRLLTTRLSDGTRVALELPLCRRPS